MVQRRTVGKTVFDIINFIVLVGIAFACIMPLWHVLMASFSDPTMLARNEGVIWWPGQPATLKGYELVFQNKNITSGYANTILYVTTSTVLGVLLTAIAGYVLSRKGVKWKNIIMFLITFTMMFNGGLVPTYMVIRDLGWINSRLAVIVPTCMSVFNIVIMRTSIQAIPDSLEESAKLDGAGHMTILFKIILPLVKATTAVLVLFYAVQHWNSWFNAMIYLQKRDLYPLQLILREILVENDISQITSSAEATDTLNLYKPLVQYCTVIVATAPILVIYPFVQKYFVTGVMIGSLKG